MLQLSDADRSFLSRMEALGLGQSDRTIQLRSGSAAQRAQRSEPPEPTVTVRCSRCGDDHHVFVYIMNTLKNRGLSPPPCEACRYRGKERADLA